MSKYIDEIVKDIKENPESWRRKGSNGLIKDDILISDTGNGWITSIASVEVAGLIDGFGQFSLMDRINIERVFKWWIRNASLGMMKK